MDVLFFFFIFFSWAMCGVFGAMVAPTRKGLGFTLGMLFGPIGILIAAVMERSDA